VINFRYHVVSLTAVFLALAIGLVVGTAALNGPVANSLNDTVNGLSNQNKQLREQVVSMEEEVNRQEDFAVEAAPHLLANKLAGRSVALVALPSANKYADGIAATLGMAGAKVVSRIDVQDKLTEPANNVELLDLAHEKAPATVVTSLPRNSDGVETSSALLAAVLMDRPLIPVPDQERDRGSVLTAYRTQGYIAVNGDVTAGADAIVAIAGAPYVDRDAAKKNAAVVMVVTQFDQAAPIVLAGTGVAGEGNAVADVRGDPSLNKTISTVDNVNTQQGRISTTLALTEQLRPPVNGEQKAGHYGIDAATLMPKMPG
jgi:hypothetical protein